MRSNVTMWRNGRGPLRQGRRWMCRMLLCVGGLLMAGNAASAQSDVSAQNAQAPALGLDLRPSPAPWRVPADDLEAGSDALLKHAGTLHLPSGQRYRVESGAAAAWIAGASIRLEPGFQALPGSSVRLKARVGFSPEAKTLEGGLNEAPNAWTLEAFPNPARNQTWLRVDPGMAHTEEVQTGPWKASLIDMAGRHQAVWNGLQPTGKGAQSILLQWEGLAPGAYLLVLEAGQEQGQLLLRIAP